MNLQEIFIENMKKFRKLRGLSQMGLAERCGTSTSYIGEIEIGAKFPSITMVEKIAAALRVKPHLLFLNEQEESGKIQEAAFIPPIPENVKTELMNQLSNVINKIIKQY